MRVVFACSANAVQKTLANLIAQNFDLCGLVLIQKKNLNQPKNIFDRFFFSSLAQNKTEVERFFDSVYNSFPDVPTFKSEKLNTMDVARFLFNSSADLLVTSQVATLKNPLLELYFSKGNINLHYSFDYKMQDEFMATNVCIAENKFHIIGDCITSTNEEGIEKVISKAAVSIDDSDDFFSIHQKVFSQGHQMLLDTISSLNANKSLNISDQQFEKRLAPEMNYAFKKNLIRNLRQFNKTKREKI